MSTFPIFDGHNDVLLRLYVEQEEVPAFFVRSTQGHLDLPRAREGGFGGGFFSVFVPDGAQCSSCSPRSARLNALSEHPEQEGATSPEVIPTSTSYEMPWSSPVSTDHALHMSMQLAAQLFRIERHSNGQAKVVRTTDQLVTCLRQGILAMVFHMEGAEAIDPGLDALEVFYQAGLRSLGIVWSRPNAFGHGVPFRFPHSPDTGPGLTDAGKALVRACNRLGILLDLSHLNEQGFWDVARLTEAPLVVTHAAAHTLCPSTRNVTDKQLDAIKASDGIVGVYFSINNLCVDGQRGDLTTPIAEVVQHIDYIAQRIGVDHVAFGSDFDGATIPQELGDVTGLPKLVGLLQEQGYDDAALRKITHENWVRILGNTWKEASRQSSIPQPSTPKEE